MKETLIKIDEEIVSRLNTKVINHQGLQTAYYDEGEGPVLVLVHGFTGSKLDFHDQIAALTQNYRVIVPDLRGHGETDHAKDAEAYTLQSLTENLHSFCEALNLNNIHLLGHSMGGMVAMRYALQHGDNLASLILMDTSSAPLQMPADMQEQFKKATEHDGLQGLLSMMRTAERSQAVQNGIDLLGETEHWARIEEKLSQMDPLAYQSFAGELGAMTDITDSLAAIKLPVLVMVGEADLPFVQPSRQMSEIIPQAQLEIIAGAAHCPQYENATRWLEIVQDHLRS